MEILLKRIVREALTDRLIHAQNHTASLHGRLDGVDLHQRRFPHKSLHVIPHPFVIEIHTRPDIALAMLHAQLRQYIRRVEPRVIAQLPGDNLKGFGEGFDNRLLLPRDVRIGVLVQERTDFHLACAPASHDGVVADGTFDDHDGVVETALGFRDELLGPAAEDERTRLGGGTAFEEIESFAADLTFFEFLAGAEVLGLDVGACGGDTAARGLDDALEVVGGYSASAEDVAVGEVSMA